jgi:hypothetical protein
MIRGTWMAVVVSAVIGSNSARADELFLIKVKEPARGDTVLIQTWRTLRTQAKGEIPDGKSMETSTRKDETAEYRQTILEIPAGQKNPSRFRREYDRAELKVEDKDTILPYQNKILLIQKNKDGRFHFHLERGPELVGNDADSLDTEFNDTPSDQWASQTAFLPRKAVRVGESWKFDPAPLFKGDKFTGFDIARAEATAKLVRAYRKDGRQFGVVEMWVEVPIKELSVGGTKLKVSDGKMIWNVTSDCCIDGSMNSGTYQSWVQMDCHALLDVGVSPKPILNVKGLVKGHTTWQEILRK